MKFNNDGQKFFNKKTRKRRKLFLIGMKIDTINDKSKIIIHYQVDINTREKFNEDEMMQRMKLFKTNCLVKSWREINISFYYKT